MDAKPDLPEIHYNLARYFNIMKQSGEEEKALRGALGFLDAAKVLTRKRLTLQIDSHTRLGELAARAEKNLDAEKEYVSAIALVEDYQSKKLIGKQSIFGQPYADLADLNYYVEGDLDSAFALYQKAIANAHTSPDIDFKLGHILYAKGEYKEALLSFSRAQQALSTGRASPNLLFAMGNAFYQRGDLFAAQGYYLRFLERLTTRKTAIGLLQPLDQPEHLSILQNLVRANNNLGVVMMRLSERTGDRGKRSEALVYLTEASETADALSRDPDTLARSEAKNLPFLNMRGILYPVSGFVLQIYRSIPKDLDALFF
jgi:tetratricopeptide (TPR) repeat protein